MKTMKRIASLVLVFALVCSFGAAFATQDDVQPEAEGTETITPRAEQTKWYYRTVDGRLQARLWSITNEKWLTEWTFL